MKAKKVLVAILLTVAIVFAVPFLQGCSARLTQAEAYAAFSEALQAARDSSEYFYDERIADGNISNIVRVLHNKNSRGEPIKEDSELSAHIHQRRDGTTVYEAFCGQGWLFENVGGTRTKHEISTLNFVNNHLNGSGLSLNEVLAQFEVLLGDNAFAAWAVFNNASRLGSLTEISLSITGYQGDSIFNGASSVSIEIVSGRISNITINRTQAFGGFVDEVTFYELFVVYYGPNLRNLLPSVSDAAWIVSDEVRLNAY
jgi:hypothetical protein